jgi:hypothetical protein
VRERDHLKQQLLAAHEDFKKGVAVKVRAEEITVSLESSRTIAWRTRTVVAWLSTRI